MLNKNLTFMSNSGTFSSSKGDFHPWYTSPVYQLDKYRECVNQINIMHYLEMDFLKGGGADLPLFETTHQTQYLSQI